LSAITALFAAVPVPDPDGNAIALAEPPGAAS
jgi:hypothetical protein